MVTIYTSSPGDLLNKFKKAIDNGHVVTWKYYGDGDFTHTPTQWLGKAYMRPSTETGKLKFNIVKAAGVAVTKPVYAVYHGRLIESITEHFDQIFTMAGSTALATTDDVIS
jgi:hypothetical protein